MDNEITSEQYLHHLRISIVNNVGMDVPSKPELLVATGVLNPQINICNEQVNLVYPSYPNVDAKIAAKLFLGLKVGIGLTKKERHQWLEGGAKETEIEFLLKGTGLEARSIKVARWLLKVLNNPEQKAALYKVRRDGTLSSHTIDLIDSDCTSGVIEAIARRTDRMAEKEFGAEVLCETPPWLNRLGGRVKLLDNAVALSREGSEMAHCVGGYASQVKSGKSFIVSIKAWGQRATAEFTPNAKLVQIKGKANSVAPKICEHLAKLAIKKKNNA
jgi:hypothetical protein